jgi:hypothetical protein
VTQSFLDFVSRFEILSCTTVTQSFLRFHQIFLRFCQAFSNITQLVLGFSQSFLSSAACLTCAIVLMSSVAVYYISHIRHKMIHAFEKPCMLIWSQPIYVTPDAR